METVMNFKSVIELLHGSEHYYTVCVDMDGNYSYINNSYKKNFASMGVDFIGKSCAINLHPEDVKVCIETAALCYANPGKLFPATLRKHNGIGG